MPGNCSTNNACNRQSIPIYYIHRTNMPPKKGKPTTNHEKVLDALHLISEIFENVETEINERNRELETLRARLDALHSTYEDRLKDRTSALKAEEDSTKKENEKLTKELGLLKVKNERLEKNIKLKDALIKSMEEDLDVKIEGQAEVDVSGMANTIMTKTEAMDPTVHVQCTKRKAGEMDANGVQQQ